MINNHEVSLLFALRTKTVKDFKVNTPSVFRNDIMCPLCGKYEDSQEHCLSCEKLPSNTNFSNLYSDIFSNDIQKQVKITHNFLVILEERQQILEHLKLSQPTSGLTGP